MSMGSWRCKTPSSPQIAEASKVRVHLLRPCCDYSSSHLAPCCVCPARPSWPTRPLPKTSLFVSRQDYNLIVCKLKQGKLESSSVQALPYHTAAPESSKGGRSMLQVSVLGLLTTLTNVDQRHTCTLRRTAPLHHMCLEHLRKLGEHFKSCLRPSVKRAV